jgi:type I restriction enzyme S subunit
MSFSQKKLGHLAEFRNGVTFVVADRGVVAKIVGVGEFRDRAEISDFNQLPEVQLRSNLSIDDELRDGDLLFVRSNGSKNLIGRCMVVKQPPKGITFSGFTIRARLNTSVVLPEYVALLFQGGALNRQMTYAGGGNGNISNLNQDLLASVKIGLPSLSLQQAIVDAAKSWDAAVGLVERLISAKQIKLQTMVSRTIAVRKTNGRLVEHWPLLRADQIFQSTSLKGYDKEPLLSVTQERGVIPRDLLEGRVTMPAGDVSAFKLVEPGNFVISLRSFQGGLEHSAYRGVVSPAYTVLRASREIDERFFRHYFRSADFIKRLAVAVIGIRDGKQIHLQDFCSIRLPFPPLKKQRAISIVLDEAEREIALLRKQVDAFRRQKRGLAKKLQTGQWHLDLPESAVS